MHQGYKEACPGSDPQQLSVHETHIACGCHNINKERKQECPWMGLGMNFASPGAWYKVARPTFLLSTKAKPLGYQSCLTERGRVVSYPALIPRIFYLNEPNALP